jgi:hypothetical protein
MNERVYTDPEPAFEQAFTELRELLRADGVDAMLVSRAGGMVVLHLQLDSEACAKCVMPRAHLERLAVGIFERAGTDVARISILDPREPID